MQLLLLGLINMTRQKVLEKFLNDKVEKIEPFDTLFLWQGIFYEVFPYSEILEDDTRKASHFVKYIVGKVIYGIREVSTMVLMTHYKNEYTKRVSN
jgi:hypothetical protein